jgi:hypothetical protein
MGETHQRSVREKWEREKDGEGGRQSWVEELKWGKRIREVCERNGNMRI